MPRRIAVNPVNADIKKTKKPRNPEKIRTIIVKKIRINSEGETKEVAQKTIDKAKDLFKKGFDVFYDDSGSIGRRYRRQDEVGTSFGITCDFQSLEDNTVTLRDRDTMKQIRVKINDLPKILKELINENKTLSDFGKFITQNSDN